MEDDNQITRRLILAAIMIVVAVNLFGTILCHGQVANFIGLREKTLRLEQAQAFQVEQAVQQVQNEIIIATFKFCTTEIITCGTSFVLIPVTCYLKRRNWLEGKQVALALIGVGVVFFFNMLSLSAFSDFYKETMQAVSSLVGQGVKFGIF